MFTRRLAAVLSVMALAVFAAGAMPVVSLLTVDAGEQIYELEGHTALRINDSSTGRDVTVSWGVFDFNSPNFLYRFTKGETDYMCVAFPTGSVLHEYAVTGRRVTEQVLDLDSAQTERLVRLVEENLRPENVTYRYNYVKDNCSLRPLAMIEAAVGDTLRLTPPGYFEYGYSGINEGGAHAEETTFRKEMSRYHSNYPWYQFGIDLALGSGLDYAIMPRERAYAPLYLHDLLSSACTVGGKKLVTVENVLVPGVEGGTSLPPTPWYATPLAVAVYVLLVTLAVSVADLRRRRISRWFDSVFYGVLFLAGSLLTFLIFVSTHEATSPNWLYLWLNPLCVIPVVFEWIKSCRRVVYCYQICNFAALVVLLACHRFLGQVFNVAFPILIVCDLIRSITYIYVYRTAFRKNNLRKAGVKTS